MIISNNKVYTGVLLNTKVQAKEQTTKIQTVEPTQIDNTTLVNNTSYAAAKKKGNDSAYEEACQEAYQLISTGTALMANPYTRAQGAALIAEGTALLAEAIANLAN